MRDFLGIAPELNAKSIKALHDASPIVYVAAGMPPYLLIHGTKGGKVPDQSPKMCEKMKAAGNLLDVFTIEGGGHGIRRGETSRGPQKL